MARTNGTDTTAKKDQNFNTSDSETKNTSAKRNGFNDENSLEALFETNLKEIYSAERQLVEALPEMAKAVDSEDLQDAINEHLQETKRQVERLEKIFNRLDIGKKEGETCVAMEGLIKEANKVSEKFERSPMRDSALIIAAQKIEHYEIAAYGSLRELADVLGYFKIREILERTLEEEEEADKHLTSIAQDVNDEAYEVSHEEEYR